MAAGWIVPAMEDDSSSESDGGPLQEEEDQAPGTSEGGIDGLGPSGAFGAGQWMGKVGMHCHPRRNCFGPSNKVGDAVVHLRRSLGVFGGELQTETCNAMGPAAVRHSRPPAPGCVELTKHTGFKVDATSLATLGSGVCCTALPGNL